MHRLSSKKLTAAFAAATLGVTAAVAASPAAAATPSWAPTATTGLKLAHASLLGAVPASQPLRLTIGLAPRRAAALDALIVRQANPRSADYRHFLTPARFTADYAASAATADAVRNYLAGQGMKHVTVSSNRLQVSADSTAAQAQQAFHTSISRFKQGGRTVLANTTAALVPSSLAGKVTGVLGLSTLGLNAGPSASLPKLTGYFPKEFTKVYDAGTTLPGTDTSLAVIAQGDLTQTVKDLRTAEAKQGLRQVPVSLVYTGPKSTDTAGADEWDLDTQTSTGIAPNAKRLYIYVAPTLSDADLAAAINKFAAQNVAKAGSASLGECDLLPYLDGSAKVYNAAFAEAAAQGQTFFASTGDTGSSCAVLPTNGVPGSGPTDTEFPASSPYVVGVGGTTLLTDSADNYTSEIAWYGGGGGISPVAASPAWQKGVSPAATLGLRGLPDVAFDADPTTGGQIYVDGAPETIGGTSLASPLALGLWTRLQASHGGRLGFASPKLYALYKTAQGSSPLPPASVPGFHDVTLGANGVYTALPGYDYTTGLGSWDVGALTKTLK